MTAGAFDLPKLGVDLSSSHTMGPHEGGRPFLRRLGEGALAGVSRSAWCSAAP